MQPQLELSAKLQHVPGVLASTKARKLLKLLLQCFVVVAIVWSLASQPKTRNVPTPRIRGQFDSDVNLQSNEFVLYRSIGNDLPPRHEIGQSYNNVKFILENEPEMPGLTKRWLLNRIFNQTEKARIVKLLESYNQNFVDKDIDLMYFEEHTKIEYDNPLFARMDHIRYTPPMADHSDIERSLYREAIIDNMYQARNRYVINNNGARNEMLELGKKDGFRWILPFDGNCFFTYNAWVEVRNTIQQGGESKYFYVPMERMHDNTELLDPDFWPEALEEPQLIFRNDSIEKFDEEKTRYGRRPKVDMLLRLAIPGVWDAQVFKSNPYYENYSYVISKDIPGNNTVPPASWVARLYSGSAAQEHSTEDSASLRKYARCKGVQFICDQAAAKALEDLHGFNPTNMLFYNKEALKKSRKAFKEGTLNVETIKKMRKCAVRSLGTTISKLIHISPAGPIYTSVEHHIRDHYEPEIAAPGRLAHFFEATSCLGLGGYILDNSTYTERAVEILRSFFWEFSDQYVSVDDMIGHIYPATNVEELYTFKKAVLGVYEFKDWYYVLDIVNLLYSESALTDKDIAAIRKWMNEYFDRIQEIAVPRVPIWGFEMAAGGPRGVWYDVQFAAIAHFYGNSREFLKIVDSSKARMARQFSNTGVQGDFDGDFIGVVATIRSEPESSKNTVMKDLSETAYVLSGWMALCQMATSAHVDLWNYHHQMSSNGPAVRGGLTVYLPYYSKDTLLPSTGPNKERKESRDRLIEHVRHLYSTHKDERKVTENILVAIFHMARDHYKDLEVANDAPEAVHDMEKAEIMPTTGTGIVRPFWNLAL
eukprot:CFRG1034T1